MFSPVQLLFVLAAALSRGAMAKPTGLAASTCSNWSLGSQAGAATVFATCKAIDHSEHDTNIALSTCLVNINGHPGCQFNGQAGSSCQFSNLKFESGSLTVDTSCFNAAGDQRIVTSGFNLDACLTNSQGTLIC